CERSERTLSTRSRLGLRGLVGAVILIVAAVAAASATAAAPTITSFTPTAATAGPNTTITITGNNFTGTTQVMVGGIASNFTVLSRTPIAVAVPDELAVAAPLTVTNPDGTATSAAVFTPSGGFGYVGATVGNMFVAPTIASFRPATAKVGQSVTITGTNLT